MQSEEYCLVGSLALLLSDGRGACSVQAGTNPFFTCPGQKYWCENSVCDQIPLLRPPLGRQTGIYVGGSSESLPSLGSYMLEISPVSSCVFYGHTLHLIPNIKRLGFLKYQQLSAPLARANHLTHRCGKA